MERRKRLTTSTIQNSHKPVTCVCDHSKRPSSWRTISRSQRSKVLRKKFPNRSRVKKIISFSTRSTGNMVSKRFSISTLGRTTKWRHCSSQPGFSTDISIWLAGGTFQAHKACTLLWRVFWCQPSWNSQFRHRLREWSIVCPRMNANTWQNNNSLTSKPESLLKWALNSTFLDQSNRWKDSCESLATTSTKWSMTCLSKSANSSWTTPNSWITDQVKSLHAPVS